MVFDDLINRQTSQTKVNTMKVEDIVNQFTANTMPSMHKGRQKPFAAALCSVLVRNELTVTAVVIMGVRARFK